MIIQNKANLLDTQMNATSAHITSYQLPVTNYQYAKQTQFMVSLSNQQTQPVVSLSNLSQNPQDALWHKGRSTGRLRKNKLLSRKYDI
jgi:hypothetical protein